MPSFDTETTVVGVLGAGAMGSGIAQVAAVAGHAVVLQDVNEEAIARARAGTGKALARSVEKGRLMPADAERIGQRIRYVASTDVAAFAPCGIVVEAIVERLDVKRETFAA